MKLVRYEKNPILSPNPKNFWESDVTCNPGAWYDKKTKTVYLLYRGAGSDAEHKISLGLATSIDGYRFQRVSNKPVFSPEEGQFDGGCVEDPRIVKFGSYYFITYACRPFPPGEYWLPEKNRRYLPPVFPADVPIAARQNGTSTGLAITKDFQTYIRLGRLTDPTVDDRDVILFPEKINGNFVLLHRPKEWTRNNYGTTHPAIWITYRKDLLKIEKSVILAKAKYDWEEKIGGSTPPIKTSHGWFMLYHAVGKDKRYRLGAMLLDLNNPTNVLHRTPNWLIQPEQWYELEGNYRGVIFPCGNVLIKDTLFVYYGGADKYIGLATCIFSELVNHLLSCPA